MEKREKENVCKGAFVYVIIHACINNKANKRKRKILSEYVMSLMTSIYIKG